MTELQARGIRLHHRVDGPEGAPPLLLCNSLGTDLTMWDRQVPAFASAFRVVRYDGRGQGRSEAPPAPYTLDELGRDALALLDALGIERAHVCGLSLGGQVALWLAAHYSERVERAAFGSTAARIGTPELWDARAEAVQAGGMAAVADTVVERSFSEVFRDRHPDEVARARGILLASPPEGYVGSCLALRDADLREAVPGIRAPSLLVAGGQDLATPVSEAEWLHAAIPGSELVVLEDAAHLCNVEQPERFSEAVLSFLAG